MSVEIIEVKTKKHRKAFVDFPYKLYKNYENWIPPLKKAEFEFIDPQQNPSLRKYPTKFFLAIKDGKVVGRIGATIHIDYNNKTGKKYVRILKPEFIDDKEVFDKLIQAAEDFGKQHNMELIHGPLGFTNLDQQGLQVEGFEYFPPVFSTYHFPYYKEHFERVGFEKENDWIEYRVTITEAEVEKAKRLLPVIKKRFGLEVPRFTSIEEAKEKYFDQFFDIVNQVFPKLPYVIPFDKELREYYLKKYFHLFIPKYIKVAVKNGELAGFAIGMPTLNRALKKANGKLYPFGFLHIMRALKKNDTMELLLAGVNPKYKNYGIGAIVIAELQNEFWKDGGRYFETTGMLEVNKAVLANWKQYQQKVQHRRRRCYVKKLG